MYQSSAYSRRRLLKTLVGLGAVAMSGTFMDLLAGEARDSTRDMPPLIPAPKDPLHWSSWRTELEYWRVRTREMLTYDDRRYNDPTTAWAAGSFSSCVLMLWDQQFFDHERAQYKVEEFLQQAMDDFGGFDSLILWHAYPRIGVDDRNQFDFYRDMPGGLAGLRDVAARCHRLGVRVFVVYKPWDLGTRREPVPDVETLATLVNAIGADGVYLDTMPSAPQGLREGLDAIGPGLVIEGEDALPLMHIRDHHMSWAQYFQDGEVPGVLRNKWFERRHMMHATARWRRSRVDQLHTAWMNGTGMVIWENVFGSWVGWSAHDRSMLRAMVSIQRRFARVFSGERWTPLVPTEQGGIYASLWEGPEVRLWTLVNRTAQPVSGTLLKIPTMAAARYFDLFTGAELSPAVQDGAVLLDGEVAPHGIAGFVAGTPVSLGPDFPQFAARQRALRTGAGSVDFPRRPVHMVSRPCGTVGGDGGSLSEMVKIPSTAFRMRVQFRVRECGFYGNEIDQDRLYAHFHQLQSVERDAALPAYAIDVTPVTNDQYAEFLRVSHYQPRDPQNFLRHWAGTKPPRGKEDHPVVYVSLEDARAYARWIGKALPTEEQWQYAAQGPEALKYPWGPVMEPGRCNQGETGTTTSVTAFPGGRSPFGCYDFCGNVWEWTESGRSDGRTRFCMIRGGSYYHAQGSHWYMDGGPQPTDFAAKFLLMWPGSDRCATIGFRCVVPLEEIPDKQSPDLQ
jgi:formylglycine-generating enzyme required for sulfatase activity